MSEGLEVVIKYRGAKFNQVASPATPSAEFAILKKDLAHLRVHSPSQKNVRRVDGSFILRWPLAGTVGPKVDGLVDSLHTRWFKLCSDDPEARKLRKFLFIDSITLTQDGVLIGATAGSGQAPQDDLPGLAKRLSDQPVFSTTMRPPPPAAPPPPLPKLPPPTLARMEKQQQQQQPPLKRRLSVTEGASDVNLPATRPKLDAPDTPSANAPQSTSNVPHPPTVLPAPASPRVDPDWRRGSSAPGDARDGDDAMTAATRRTPFAGTPSEVPMVPGSPVRDLGEMASRPAPPLPLLVDPPGSPQQQAQLGADVMGDVGGLMRALREAQRQLAAMQAHERTIINDLERLGARPESANVGVDRVSRDELSRLEAELRTERARRVRAEQALSDVERERRTPFVVPALFQAFISLSELSS